MTEEPRAKAGGLHHNFKLQSTYSQKSMMLLDSHGCVKTYDSIEEMFKEFYDFRLGFYEKRKEYFTGLLQAISKMIENQARFLPIVVMKYVCLYSR
jgi:DNA topoisomerase-2